VGLYDIDSDAPTAINRDDSYKVEEIHNSTSSKGIAKDAKAQSIRPFVGPGSATVSLELRLWVRSHTY
jgi:hypothetical protein